MSNALLVLFMLTNLARFNSVPLLEADHSLNARAELRADELCDKGQWSHKGWENSFKGLPYKWKGENLVKGTSNMRTASRALLTSPGHKANIVNPLYTDMGIGYSDECKITVELFGGN